MTVNFWCGFVAFMAVCFGFVLFFVYDYTGSEPETVLDRHDIGYCHITQGGKMNYFGLFFSFFLPGLIIGMWLGMGAKEGRRKTK